MKNQFEIQEQKRGSMLEYMGLGALLGIVIKGFIGGIKTKQDFGIGLFGGMTVGALTRGIIEISDSNDDDETEVKGIELITDTKKIEIFDIPYGIKYEDKDCYVRILEIGREYEFKVSEYTICRPKNLERIKWELTAYSDSDIDRTVDLYTEIDWTNSVFRLTINDKNLIGKRVVISAYINDKLPTAKVVAIVKNDFHSFTFGHLQNDKNLLDSDKSVARKWDLDDFLKIKKIASDKLAVDRLRKLSLMSEQEIRKMYEGGIVRFFKLLGEICMYLNHPFVSLYSYAKQCFLRNGFVILGKDEFVSFFFKFVGTAVVLSNADNLKEIVINHFYNGNGEPFCWGTKSNLSKNLKENVIFQNYFKSYLTLVKEYISNPNISEKELLEMFETKLKFVNFSSIRYPNYYGLMGGTQKLKVDLDIIKLSEFQYQVSTIMHIYDWYGTDFEDIQGTKLKAQMECLNAFFWLQNHYGYKPFQTEIIYESIDIITIK